MKTQKILTTMHNLSPLIKEILRSGTDVVITVTGNSMVPLFRHMRDRVVLTSCDPQRLIKGDIPLYMRADGKYVLHRIVKVNDKTFNLAGDSQWEIEYNLEKERCFAVVKGFYRKGGKLCSVKHPLYLVLSTLWRWLLPVREYIFKTKRLIWRLVK